MAISAYNKESEGFQINTVIYTLGPQKNKKKPNTKPERKTKIRTEIGEMEMLKTTQGIHVMNR